MKAIFSFLILITALPALAHVKSDSLYITTSDSVQLFVKIAGKGKPVLFIHGGPGSNSAYFEREGGNIFEQDVQMIYMDQRGCGRSGNAKNNDYSLERFVKDFEEVREALGIKKWTLMPHSFGGILANQYAFLHSDKIQSMVLLNCTLHIASSAHSGITTTINILNDKLNQREKEYLLNDNVPLMDRWFNAFWHLSQHDLKHALMFDKKQSAYLDSVITSSASKTYEFGQKVWSYPEYFEDHTLKTKEINVPVLVIGGTRDYTIGVDHPKKLKYPNMEIKYIGGGHALYLEHNKELYDAVSPFLKN
jgi:proline iminopeptidase